MCLTNVTEKKAIETSPFLFLSLLAELGRSIFSSCPLFQVFLFCFVIFFSLLFLSYHILSKDLGVFPCPLQLRNVFFLFLNFC